MKSRVLTWITGMTLFALLAMPARIVAQEEQQQAEQLQHYTVTDLGTLGGTFGIGFGVNNRGHVAGAATLADGNEHAFLWRNGALTDLGTLGGPNSIADGPNVWDELAIFSDTSTTDPLGEDFCGFGTGLTCLGAIWRNGALTPLSTLGGNNGTAYALNDRGQVTGLAENGTRDTRCPSPQVLDFEAVIWGPEPGEIQELQPLSGDSVGFALGINDHGQAVGSSGTCANTPLVPMPFGPHAVLWQNGYAADLGNLGGELNNTAATVNDRGEVAGASDLAGDTTYHTFLWTKGTGIQDLGTVGTDFSSYATWINNKGQVVGVSCSGYAGSGSCRAYLWQNNVMMDLNTLIPADSPLYLLTAFGINDVGEIAGSALQTSTGDVHAFLATPSNGEAGDESISAVSQGVTSPKVLPENARKLATSLSR